MNYEVITGHENDNNSLFDWMLQFDGKNYAMGCCISKYKQPASTTGFFQDNGIVLGHAYGLISVKRVQANNGQELRFVNIRNPHGYGDKNIHTGYSTEWNGDWSDNSALWQQYPEVAQQLNYRAMNDGRFWMEWKDFTGIFDKINVVPKAMTPGAPNQNDQGPPPIPIALDAICKMQGMEDLRAELEASELPYDPYANLPTAILGDIQRTSPIGLRWMASKPGKLQELIDFAKKSGQDWQVDFYMKKIQQEGLTQALDPATGGCLI